MPGRLELGFREWRSKPRHHHRDPHAIDRRSDKPPVAPSREGSSLRVLVITDAAFVGATFVADYPSEVASMQDS